MIQNDDVVDKITILAYRHQDKIDSRRFSGSEPGIGSFDCRIDPTGDDWAIFIVPPGGDMIERWSSTWKGEPCGGLTKVFEILRSHGFTISGEAK